MYWYDRQRPNPAWLYVSRGVGQKTGRGTMMMMGGIEGRKWFVVVTTEMLTTLAVVFNKGGERDIRF